MKKKADTKAAAAAPAPSSASAPAPSPPSPPGPSTTPPAVRPITLADLTDDLLWPRLFRATPLALRPDRLGIAIFVLVLVGLLGRAFAAVTDSPAAAGRSVGESLDAIVGSLRSLEPLGAVLGFVELTLGVPALGIREHPWWGALFLLPLTLVLAVGGGAICRMAACEFSQSVMLAWPRALGFAVSRWVALWLSLLAPLMIAALFVVMMAVGGWLLLNWPGVNIAGALLYPVFLFGGLLVVLLLLGYALGSPMLVPALACEGSDAIDAVQRAYAYVVGRPLRLILYIVILGLQLAVMTAVLGSIAAWLVMLTQDAATAWTGANAGGIFDPLAEPQGTWGVASRIVAFWVAIPTLIVGGFVLSYVFTASTILYLLLRQLNDGQDTTDIWMPGMVGGTTAQAASESAPAGALEPENGDA